MSKRRDGRVTNALINGKDSKPIQKFIKDMKLSALDAVSKANYNSFIEETITRRDAVIQDTFTTQYFAEMLKQFGPDVFSYEMDLTRTQTKMIENKAKIDFHRKALKDLMEQYENATDAEKPVIYEQIEKCEKILTTFDSKELSVLELRNKIRKELDKKVFQEQALDLKNQEIGKKSTIQDIDFSVIDVE